MPNLQVLAAYSVTTPGNCCYLCGSTRPDERVLSTGLSIDFEGTLEICESCVVDLGRLIGMATAPEVTQLRDEVTGALNQLAESQTKVDAAQSSLDQLTAAFATLTTPGTPEPFDGGVAAESEKPKRKVKDAPQA